MRLLLIMLIMLIMSSCGNKSFFVSKEALDPFTVYSYQPLSLPPVYYLSSQEVADERRFIKEGKNRMQSLLFEDQAVAFFKKKADDEVLGNSDQQFLKLAKADKNLSKVRAKLDEESLGLVSKEPSFIAKVFLNYKGEGLDDKLAEYKKYNR